MQVSCFKDFKIGVLIKVTGFLNGSLYGGIITTKDKDQEFKDDIDFIAGYSVIAYIVNQKEVDTGDYGIEYEFQFDVPIWKWAQLEPVMKRKNV